MTQTYLGGPLAKVLIPVLVGILLAQPGLMGQANEQPPLQAETWNGLTAAATGSRVRLIFRDGREVRGRLVEASADAVILEDVETGSAGIRLAPGQSLTERLTFLRADTSQVEILSQPGPGLSTGRKIAIGVAIGVAAFAAFMFSACGSFVCLGQ